MKPQNCWIPIFILLLLYNNVGIIHSSPEQRFSNKSSNVSNPYLGSFIQYNHNSCNSSDKGQTVKVEFSSKVVDNEYIVAFKGYYKRETRENYVRAALGSAAIDSWKILSRANVAAKYPSDFDIVQINEIHKQDGLDALLNHPLVRRITPQKIVQRTLKYVDNDEDNTPEYKYFKRKLHNEVSIESFSYFLNCQCKCITPRIWFLEKAILAATQKIHIKKTLTSNT